MSKKSTICLGIFLTVVLLIGAIYLCYLHSNYLSVNNKPNCQTSGLTKLILNEGQVLSFPEGSANDMELAFGSTKEFYLFVSSTNGGLQIPAKNNQNSFWAEWTGDTSGKSFAVSRNNTSCLFNSTRSYSISLSKDEADVSRKMLIYFLCLIGVIELIIIICITLRLRSLSKGKY